MLVDGSIYIKKKKKKKKFAPSFLGNRHFQKMIGEVWISPEILSSALFVTQCAKQGILHIMSQVGIVWVTHGLGNLQVRSGKV